jgi:hypothetical protein
MIRRLWDRLRSRRTIEESIVLRDDGFGLYQNKELKGELRWSEVVTATASKKNLVAFDLICLEFQLADGSSFVVNDDARGFWELVEEGKRALAGSRQDWESAVLQAPSSQTPVTIYRRQ